MQSSYYSCLWKRLIQKRGSWLFLFFFSLKTFSGSLRFCMVVVQVSEGGGHGERDQFPSSEPRGGLSLGSCAQFFISADLRFPSPSINGFLYFGPPTQEQCIYLEASGDIFLVKERKQSKKRTGLVVLQSRKKIKNHEGQALAQMKSKEQIKTQSRCCWFTACMYTCMGRVQVCLYRDW